MNRTYAGVNVTLIVKNKTPIKNVITVSDGVTVKLPKNFSVKKLYCKLW